MADIDVVDLGPNAAGDAADFNLAVLHASSDCRRSHARRRGLWIAPLNSREVMACLRPPQYGRIAARDRNGAPISAHWAVSLYATPRGRVQTRAQLNAALADDIVAARHGWWQACPELELPGHDPLDSKRANPNLAIDV